MERNKPCSHGGGTVKEALGNLNGLKLLFQPSTIVHYFLDLMITSLSEHTNSDIGSKEQSYSDVFLFSSDLDQRTKAILSLIEEEGDSLTQRAEICYQRRPQLVKMVEDFHRSYRALAEKYDQMRAESPTEGTHLSSSSSSNSLKQFQDAETATNKDKQIIDPKLELASNPESVVEDPETEIIRGNQNLYDEKANQSCHVSAPGRVEISEKIGELELDYGEMNKTAKKTDFMWKDFSSHASLLEDLFRQQGELIRRNEEKRRSIKELHLQLDNLNEENRVLQNCLCRSGISIRRNPSRVKRLLSWKFWFEF
ncbi:protein NETWORKED 3C-like [Aristolochia californica]|uniref:protein NETWORKED 3C-like n=1 Tax=Aristolochia californica TaxID=171875 RepID=UPI0035D65E4B